MMKSKTVIPAAYVTAGGDVAGRQRQEERRDARGLSRDAPARRGTSAASVFRAELDAKSMEYATGEMPFLVCISYAEVST